MQSLSSSFTSTLTIPTSAPSFLRRLIPIQTPTTTISATLAIGDKLPKATFSYLNYVGEVKTTTVSDLIKGKKAILFAIRGAFTPTCSQNHILGFLEKSTKLKAMGVDTSACVSVNDTFIMRVWKNDLKVSDEVLLLFDGIRTLTLVIGCELNLCDKLIGLGIKSMMGGRG